MQRQTITHMIVTPLTYLANLTIGWETTAAGARPVRNLNQRPRQRRSPAL